MNLYEIREAFRRTGKSRAGLADVLGVDVSQISRLLNGKRHLKVHEVPLIDEYFYGQGRAQNDNGYSAQSDYVPVAQNGNAVSGDSMRALETISELLDEAERFDIDVARTITRALRHAIDAQRHMHTTGF